MIGYVQLRITLMCVADFSGVPLSWESVQGHSAAGYFERALLALEAA